MQLKMSQIVVDESLCFSSLKIYFWLTVFYLIFILLLYHLFQAYDSHQGNTSWEDYQML